MAQQTIGIGAAPNDGNGDDIRVAYDKINDNFDELYGQVIRRISIHSANFGIGATAPTQVILGNYTGWEYDINDDTVFTIELPNDVDTSEDIALHIDWYCGETYAANSGEVRWEMAWSLCPADNSEAVDAPTHTGTIDTGDINIPANAKYLVDNTTLIIAAASIADVDDILGARFKRIALVGGNNPTAKPTIVALHLEYTSKFM